MNSVGQLRAAADDAYRNASMLTSAANEIARLHQVLLSIEIALSRDGDIEGAMKLILNEKRPALSDETKARLKEIDDNIRNAAINAGNLIAG